MVEIRIICVGNIKQRYFKEALEEYYKRLGAFCSLKVIEVKEERLSPSRTIEGVVEAESERLMQKLDGYAIALDPRGKQMSSPAFAQMLGDLIDRGVQPIDFVVGGSHGLSEKLLKRSQRVLSFSEMTFPHQLFRVMLSEQIYRAFTIRNHQNYHK